MEPEEITLEKYTEMMDEMLGELLIPLYYRATEYTQKGQIIHVAKVDYHPEYILFHPDDRAAVEDLAQRHGRKLVHLSD